MSLGRQFDGFNTLSDIDQFAIQTASQMYQHVTSEALSVGSIPTPFFHPKRQGSRYLSQRIQPSYLKTLRYANVLSTVVASHPLMPRASEPIPYMEPICFAITSDLLHPEKEVRLGAVACIFALYIGNAERHKGLSSPAANRRVSRIELFDDKQAVKIAQWTMDLL
jgi:hypothetical protein